MIPLHPSASHCIPPETNILFGGIRSWNGFAEPTWWMVGIRVELQNTDSKLRGVCVWASGKTKDTVKAEGHNFCRSSLGCKTKLSFQPEIISAASAHQIFLHCKKGVTNTLKLLFSFRLSKFWSFHFHVLRGKMCEGACATVSSAWFRQLQKVSQRSEFPFVLTINFFWQCFGPNRMLANVAGQGQPCFAVSASCFPDRWIGNMQSGNRLAKEISFVGIIFLPVQSRRASTLIFFMQVAADHPRQKL